MPKTSSEGTQGGLIDGYSENTVFIAAMCVTVCHADEVAPTGLIGAYARNGEIHVNEFGTPEEPPLTTGHKDIKPSWSKTGDTLVFFRLTKPAPRVSDWRTAICIVKTDGTGFEQLTDGTHTDFNPTRTRDGTNLVVFNRRNGRLPTPG